MEYNDDQQPILEYQGERYRVVELTNSRARIAIEKRSDPLPEDGFVGMTGFGASAPAPRFALPDLQVAHAREVGSGHLKVRLRDGMGNGIDAISFGAFDTDLGPTLSNHGGARFHVAGRLEINSWGGRSSVQLRLDDAAKA